MRQQKSFSSHGSRRSSGAQGHLTNAERRRRVSTIFGANTDTLEKQDRLTRMFMSVEMYIFVVTNLGISVYI